MDLLGGEVPVAALEQKARQRQTLAGRPQFRGAEPFQDGGEWAMMCHVADIRRPGPDVKARLPFGRSATPGQSPVRTRSTSSRTVGTKPLR
ncbi:hypothetical protein STVA_03370 [Allostella vacuolata]|nr:hypothetical protein STVA_03370 [Stella vacuolata]